MNVGVPVAGRASGGGVRFASVLPLIRRTTHAGVKAGARGVDLIRPPEPGVVVLAYHRVGANTGLEVDLEPSVFAEQMDFLRTARRTVSIERALDDLAHPTGSPSVVVTFDDGTADFVEHALPVLVASNVPATYYVATDFIEGQRSFPDNGTPMTWAGLAEAVSTGLVTVGSHTHSHAVMDKLTVESAETELRRSAELIEDRLGVTVDHFAYPKGVLGGIEVEKVVARRFRSAALAGGATNSYGSTNPFRLERSPVQRADGMGYFRAKVDGGLRLEGLLRNRLNRRRYGAATN